MSEDKNKNKNKEGLIKRKTFFFFLLNGLYRPYGVPVSFKVEKVSKKLSVFLATPIGRSGFNGNQLHPRPARLSSLSLRQFS